MPLYLYFQYAIFTWSKFVLFGIKLCIALWNVIEKLLFFNVQVPLWRLNNPALFSVKVLLHQTMWILPGQHLQNFQVSLLYIYMYNIFLNWNFCTSSLMVSENQFCLFLSTGLFVTVFLIERIGRKFTMGFEFFVFSVFVLLANICTSR